MTEQHPQQAICKSVFKNGEQMTKAYFTKEWIRLISLIEKNACTAAKERKL